MKTIDLKNLDQTAAAKAIEKARESKPWVTRKGKAIYRVRARVKNLRRPADRQIHTVEFFFSKGARLATCDCDAHRFGAQYGRLCYHVAAAFVRHLANQKRARAQRTVAA